MKYILILVLFSASGCASYQEVGYTPISYPATYSESQYNSDERKAKIVALRQREYDRHQNEILRRSRSSDRMIRNNFGIAAGVIGAGLLIRNQIMRD